MARIGLVLGAGGVTGFAFHAGTLAGLQHVTGWDPRTADVIVGTSAGSGVAALLRGGVPTVEIVERQLAVADDRAAMRRMQSWSSSLLRPQRRWPTPSSLSLARRELAPNGQPPRVMRVLAALAPEGSEPTEPMGDRARALLGDAWPSLPLWIVAMRLSDGHRVVLGRDSTEVDVGRAVEASSAIPGAFRPVDIGGERHVDGGVHSPTNADLLADQRLDAVVVVSPMSGPSEPAAVRPDRLSRRLSRRRLDLELGRLHVAGTHTLVVEPDRATRAAMGSRTMDPARIGDTVRSAIAGTVRRSLDPSVAEILRAAADRTPPLDQRFPAV